MEFFALSLLVGIDIILGLIRDYIAYTKPQPLTFLQFFNFMYDYKEDLIKILEEENEETRKQMFENYLKTKDLLDKNKKL